MCAQIHFPPSDRPLTPRPSSPKNWPAFILGVLITLVVFFLISYLTDQAPQSLSWFQKAPSPHQRYQQMLRESGIVYTQLGKTWISAGEIALQDSLVIRLPYRERSYIAPSEALAHSYCIDGKQGEQLEISLAIHPAQDTPQVFIDLFAIRTDRQKRFRRLASADSGSYRLSYRIRRNESLLLRVQAELLADLAFEIQVLKQPSLAFPVSGKDHSSVGSFWGAPRDGGRRKHEGIDIFAARGTPVLASVSGTVSRVRNGGLGGKVVWLRDALVGQSLYYAHLDSQWVYPGQQVRVGDTLGTIGNTGNARFTPPHLHFGIYCNRGAVDPYPFVYQPDTTFSGTLNAELSAGRYARSYSQNIRTSPFAPALASSQRLKILAVSAKAYRVRLASGEHIQLPHRYVRPITQPLKQERLPRQAFLRAYPRAKAPVKIVLPSGAQLQIWAYHHDQVWVSSMTDPTQQGWLNVKDFF